MSDPDAVDGRSADSLGGDPVASPCTGICRIVESDGRCAGCLRTLGEIASWGGLDEAARRALLEELERRRQQIPSNPGSAPSSAISASGSPGNASRGRP